MLLKKIGTYQFAIADMALFLDTHPDDTASVMQLEEYERTLRPLVEEYEAKFGPLRKRQNNTNTWSWVKNPWPWDVEEDD